MQKATEAIIVRDAVKEDTLIVEKREFLVEVINCPAQTESKTEKIKITVNSAGK